MKKFYNYLTRTGTKKTSKNATSTIKSLLATLLLLFMANTMLGQSTANYTFTSSTTNSLDDLSTGATTILSAATSQDDTGTLVYPIGFNFYFMGQWYSHFSTNSNGQVRLHQSAGATAIGGAAVSTYSAGVVTLAPMGGDNETGVGAGIRIKVTGTAPNRKFVLEWNNFYVNWTDITNGGKMQMWLNETSGKIDYVYGEIFNSNSLSVTKSIFISSSNTTANTSGHVLIGATPTYVTNVAAPATNTIAAGSGTTTGSPLIANLGSSAQGSRVSYSFTPSVATPAGPTALTLGTITTTGMILNWTAASPPTGIVRYVVLNSTDNVNFNFVANVALGTNTYTAVANSLTPGTLYYWKVVAVTEGKESTATTASATTLTAATYYWVGASGSTWNTAANWNTLADGTGTTRTAVATTDILIVDGAGTTAGAATTISVNLASFTIGQFKVTSNTACTLNSSATTQRIITIFGSPGDDFVIENGSSLLLTNTANPISFVFSATILGNTGNIAGTLTVAGTSTTASAANSFLTTANSSTVVTVTNTGIINNTATTNISTNGNVTGSAATLVFASGSSYNVSGATTGAPWIPLATWDTNSNLSISGLTSSTTTPTNTTIAGTPQSFGNVTFNCPALTSSYPFATSVGVTVKGNLSVTTGSGNFRLVSSGTATVNGNVLVSAGTFSPFSGAGTVNVLGNTTINTGTTLDLSLGAGTYGQRGSLFTNDGTVKGTGTTTVSTLQFYSPTNVAQTLAGAGTFAPAVNSLSLQNTGGLTITHTNPVNILRANLFQGTVTNSNKLTMGTGAALAVTTQTGYAGSLTAGGSFDVAPTWNLGTGTYGLIYAQESVARTTGFEIPPTRLVNNINLTNSNGLVVSGGALSSAALTLGTSCGNITTDVTNILTITGTATTAITRTNATAYINGPLQLTLPASNTTGTYVFPVGKSALKMLELVSPVTTAGGTVVIKSEVFDADCGGNVATATPTMISLNTNRYWSADITSGAANFTSSAIRLNDSALGTATAIANSATVAGSYDLVGGLPPVLVASTSIASNVPQPTTLGGFYCMGIEIPNPCPNNPTALVSSAIAGTTATISWTAPASAPASGYEYYYSTSATQPLASATPSGSVGAGIVTANLTGLTGATKYYYWVRSNCNGTDKGNWQGSANFTTLCTSYTLPWTESFETIPTIGTSLYATCWSFTNVTSTNYSCATTCNSSTARTGTKFIGGSWSFDVWHYTPAFDLVAGTSYNFSYWSRTADSTGGYTVTATLGNGQSVAAQTTTIGTNSISTGNTTYTKTTYTFIAPSTGTFYLGIHNVGTSPPNGIAFDDFELKVTPVCTTVVTALTSSALTPTTATISWTAPASAPANGYEYYLSTSATAPTDTTPATGATAAGIVTTNLTSLTANTLYYYWVRTVCSASDKGEWTGSTFTTPCNPLTIPWTENFEGITTVGTNLFPTCWSYSNITSTNYSCNGTCNSSTAHGGTKFIGGTWSFDVWHYTPGFNLVAGTSYDYSFWTRQADTVNGYTITSTYGTGQSVATQTNTLGTEVIVSGTTWVKKTFTFTPATSGVYYFGLHNSCPTSSPNGIAFDDFSLIVTPPCPDPSAVTYSAVTNTSATMSWTAGTPTGPSITSHEYYYSTSNTAPNAGTTPSGTVAAGTNTASLTGLSANTTYYTWVRSNCTVNLSGWISGGSFTTTNVVYSVYTNSTPKSFNDTIDIYFEDLHPVNDFYTDNQTNVWMYAGVDTGAGAWGFNSNANINNNTTLVNFAQTATTGLYKATIKLADYFCVPASAGTVYGINLLMENQWGPGGNNQTNNLYLDLTDAVVSINPPTAVATSAITHNAATLSWVAPVQGANKGYEYAYSTTNTAPTSGTATSATTINLTGLATSTTYYYWVRTMGCSPDASTWVAGTFTTTCQTPTLTAVNGSRCGTGTVDLSVTSDITSTVNWYAASTGGTSIQSGLTYTTPSITGTTSYWVEAIGGLTTSNIGLETETGSSGSLGAYGMYFSTVKAATINSVDIYPSTVGTINVTLKNNVGTTITTQAFTIVAGDISTTVKKTLALTGFNIPSGSTGWTINYDLAINRGTATYNYPYSQNGFVITGNTLDGNNITGGTRYFFYNWNVSVADCISTPRTQVTATVTAPPTLSVDVTSGSSCAGTATALVSLTSTPADYDTYSWSPAGATGDENAGWTFTSTTSKVFTLTATNSVTGCSNTLTYTYTATPAPTDVDITNVDAVACLNKLQTITATGGLVAVPVNATIGTATTTTTANGTEPTAFNNRYANYKMQTVYTAAELTSAGLSAGNISSMSFTTTTLGDAATNSNYLVKIGTTSLSTLTSTFESTTGYTTVYNAATHTHTASGVQTITFTTPYNWNGTSNIIIEVSHNGVDTTNNAVTYYTATASNTVITTQSSTAGVSQAATTGTASTKRLNVTFAGTTSSQQITWSATDATLFTDAAGTVAYTAPGVYPTTVYAKPTASGAVITATATLGGCPKSDSVTFTTGTSTWDGFSWDNAPTGNTSLIIDGDYTEATDVVGCDCTITTNASTVTIPSGNTMTLTNGITNNGTSMVFESGASLLQTNPAAVNTGVITYNRTTPTLVNNLDFVYWGSPVSNQQIKNIWMTTANDTFYSFDASVPDWAYVAPSTVMLPGRGYIARAVDGATNATGNNTGTFTINGTWNAPFVGAPNNGNYPIGVYAAPGIDNLLGNPYPSALDLNQLKTDNTALLGTFYFWNHSTGINSNSYDAAGDYAIYNANTGFGTAAGSGGTAPDQYVDAAQGFFADAATTGTVTFKNTQRVAGNNNAFYRVAPSTAVATPTSYALWLNLTGIAGTSTAGAFKQQFVGYVVNTTNNFDAGYDVNVYGGNPTIDFYSTIPSHKLAMQCRDFAFAFTDADVVPLGFQSIAGGTFKISIDHSGTHDASWYSGQRVYLQDNLLGIDFDLTNADYSFTTAAGTFDNRFVLKYTSTLGTNSEDYLNNSVIVAKDKNVLRIKSSIEEINKVTIFDMLGREVYKKDTINSKEFSDINIIRNQQTLIVKVTLANGVIVSKKIVY